MQLLSIAIGKTTFALLRLLGRTGSALPGLIVERIDPSFLRGMLAQLPQGVVVISGTNGKTTTTKLVTKLLESQGLRVLTNPTGSNFVRGTISAVVDGATWGGTLPYDIAVFEQDEAHAVHFARQVKPRVVVVLNIMRDQMDRFGEIDTTRKLLQELAAAATETVVLNANDERVSTIVPTDGVRTVWYAHSADLQRDFLTDDQLYHAESPAYELGGHPETVLTAYSETSVSLKIGATSHRYAFQLPGGHNALNLAAALTTVNALVPSVDEQALSNTIAKVEPVFGRGEMVQIPGGARLTIQLIKNPGGFSQSLRVLRLKQHATVGIAINDDYADGRDVSWLWDVDFTGIKTAVLCGGTRAADMANRLKYDDVAHSLVEADIDSYVAALDHAAAERGGDAIVFCTYTAMRKIRSHYSGVHSGLGDA